MKIDRIFSLVNFIANKHQKGYLSPDEFNLLVNMVQMQLFKERYGLPEEYQPGQHIPRVALEVTQKIADDMRHFKKTVNLNISSEGKVNYPTDYVHKLGIRKKAVLSSTCTSNTSRWVKVKVVDENHLSYRLGSSIVAPDLEYPICTLYDTYIQFYPINLQSASFVYLRVPTTAKWAYTLANAREVFDSSNSTDIEFNEDVVNDFIIRILSKVGIHLREPDLVQYSELKKNQGI